MQEWLWWAHTPLGLLALHPAILGPPPLQCRITDLRGLQHYRQILAGVEHRVSVPQLRHDVVGAVLLPSSRRRKSPCP